MKATSSIIVCSLILLSAAFSIGAAAQANYPSRPVRILVPQSPGSGGDLVARLLSERLQDDLKQPFVVENKAGANGILAAAALGREAPDGYTVMLAGVSQVSFNQHLYNNLSYDAFKDFTFITPVVDTPFVLVVSRTSGVKDFAEFVRRGTSKQAISYSSAGPGNSTHLVMAMLASKANIKIHHIAYKGSGPALLSVVAGETDAMASVLGAALPQISAGKVIPIAVFGEKRSAQLPAVPTLGELGLALPPMPGWYALVAPKNVEHGVSNRLAAAVQDALADPRLRAKLADLSLVAIAGTGPEIRKRAEDDSRVWGEFIKVNTIKPD